MGAAADATGMPKSIIELQPFRQQMRAGELSMIDLNPTVGAWFLLTLPQPGGATRDYHLENPRPGLQALRLDAESRLRLTGKEGEVLCSLDPATAEAQLELAARSGLPYAPLCEGRLYLRNSVPGTATALERITDLLRDHVWGGDRLVTWVRDALFTDAFIERGRPLAAAAASQPLGADVGPPIARLGAAFEASAVAPEHLGIELGVASLELGRWYPVPGEQGIDVSAIEPLALQAEAAGRERLNPLDAVEAAALDYLVAFDVSQFELRFALGTDHPRLGWSERSLESVRDPRTPGPDGIASAAPLVRTGMVSPELVSRTVAAFAGGFKREHGAFRYGPLARQNAGSHYGFLEQGVVFSKLEPGLATVLSTRDGRLEMKTWSAVDDRGLAQVAFARQNGVPLLEPDIGSGQALPGMWVAHWGEGNWSGSSDERLRTVRAGLCLAQSGPRRYLIFGYFSSATPSAMARVFQAYGCRYAMHLDMNALEHTYFALYGRQDGQIRVQHLIEGMAVVDRKGGRGLAPRFLAFPDDRDFFYLTRHEEPEP